MIKVSYSDASGNPVTQQVQSVAVTDASGNPVTGIISYYSKFWYIFLPPFSVFNNFYRQPS